MSRLTIQTLNLMVRGFSNEVTVNWLSAKLGISYSTLVRCKNGVWPRSVTRQAMQGVFDECRIRFFDGDGERLARCALDYLEHEGIDSGRFASALESGGFDAFVSELIDAAREPGTAQDDRAPAVDMPKRESAPASGGAHAPASVGTHSSASAGTHSSALVGAPMHASVATVGADVHKDISAETGADQPAYKANTLPNAVVALPVAVILLIGLLNVPIGALLSWAADHLAVFTTALLAIAVSPVLAGALVDAPLAWHAWLRDNADAKLTLGERLAIAKFGGPRDVVPGAGRFDLSPRHCAYQCLCNVLGALCVISLLFYLSGLPGFTEFCEEREWVEFFKVGVAVGFFVAFSHNRELSALPPCSSADWPGENPDNYLPTRAHVWANTVHLVVTFSFVCILVLAMLAYSVVNFRTTTPSLGVLLPYAFTVAFLAYSSVSPYAERVEALGAGALLPGVVAASVGVAVLVLVCYLPSWQGAVICAVCAATLAGMLAWRNARLAIADDPWVARARKSREYSFAVVAALAIMLAIGLATAAFA